MDEHVVHQEVRKAVECDAGSNPHTEVATVHGSGDEAQRTRNSENEKEHVVFFEKARLVYVVVFMKVPHEAVHDVFMCEPRHEFHDEESGDDNQYGYHCEKTFSVEKNTICTIKNSPATRLVLKCGSKVVTMADRSKAVPNHPR